MLNWKYEDESLKNGVLIYKKAKKKKDADGEINGDERR